MNIVKRKNIFLILSITISFVIYSTVTNASDFTNDIAFEHFSAQTFFWIAIILLFAKILSLIERLGQPAILGELVAGIVLGNLYIVGIDFFEPIKNNSAIAFLGSLGIVFLLFRVGLGFNFNDMKRTGLRSFLVAIVAVVCSFVLGVYVVGPLFFPHLSYASYLFLGAALTATSIGVTARIFKDLGKSDIKEAQIVLGAAAIDDIIGLIILAIVSSIAISGAVDLFVVLFMTAKTVVLFGAAIFIGHFTAPFFGRLFSWINAGVGMKFSLAIGFCLFFAYLADVIGLAPVVGAFAAGLILDPVHFCNFRKPKFIYDIEGVIKHVEDEEREKSQSEKHLREDILTVCKPYMHHHIEDIIDPLGYFLIPIFFVTVGMSVNLMSLFNIPLLLISLGVAAAAVFGKIISGLVAGSVNKWVVGWSMVARGEVALIFATIGMSLGVVTDELFSVIIIMVLITILVPPIILAKLLKK